MSKSITFRQQCPMQLQLVLFSALCSTQYWAVWRLSEMKCLTTANKFTGTEIFMKKIYNWVKGRPLKRPYKLSFRISYTRYCCTGSVVRKLCSHCFVWFYLFCLVLLQPMCLLCVVLCYFHVVRKYWLERTIWLLTWNIVPIMHCEDESLLFPWSGFSKT